MKDDSPDYEIQNAEFPTEEGQPPQSPSLQLISKLIERWRTGKTDSDLREEAAELIAKARLKGVAMLVTQLMNYAVQARDYLQAQEQIALEIHMQVWREDLTIKEGLLLFRIVDAECHRLAQRSNNSTTYNKRKEGSLWTR